LDKVFEKIKEEILKNVECEAIVLFGSFSRNTQKEDSDIDIAIKPLTSQTKKQIFELKNKLEDVAKRDIDLIDLNEANDCIKYEILMTGITLYCKDEFKFEMYKLDAYREFLDLNESRMSIIERVKNGGTIYGE
jgi:uncharacterized protein